MVVKNYIDFIENWHNRASDTNFVWFPFLQLKLLPDEKLRHTRLLVMTICFAGYFNGAYLLKETIFSGQISVQSSLISQAYFTVGFFVWFNLVTRPLWNRRACRLKARRVQFEN